MEAEAKVVHFLGLDFSVPVIASTVITCLIIFIFCWLAGRKATLRPGKLQAALEYIMDFTKGLIENSLDWQIGEAYHLFIFTLFLFILVANSIGLAVYIHYGEYNFFTSPTASPVVCLTLSLVVSLITHYSGIQRMGFLGYLKQSFLSPMPVMFPIKIIEEFTNTITLAFRLYGNIYAGEVLLGLVVLFSASFGWMTSIAALPLGIIWQGFSLAIGAIQAYVFCTLSMVYISHKLEHE